MAKNDTANEEIVDEKVEQEENIINEDDSVEIEFDDENEEDDFNETIKELEDKHTRLLAEYQNYKRRTLEESTKTKALVKKDVISDVIDVLDNLERALSHIDFDADGEVDDLAKGIKMVYDNFKLKLTNMGVLEVDCSGLIDPNNHHAVATDNVEDLENDQIIEVLQKGYTVDGILIRPAMVKANQK